MLLATDEGRLKLVATNLEMAITYWLGAKVEDEGAITVPAKLLNEFVASLPSDKINMSLSARTALQLKCARFEARISGIDAKDFPRYRVSKTELLPALKPKLLERVLKVVFAAATDESRPVLTGINAEFDGDTLTLAVADGFRLAVYNMPLATRVDKKTTAIIPSKTLAELNRMVAEQEDR